MNPFTNFIRDFGNYDQRKIGRTERKGNNGIGVSTAYTSDEGYETALMDSVGVHPVERYPTKEKAKLGHKKWVRFAKTGTGKKVTKLGGLGGLVGDERITLKGGKI